MDKIKSLPLISVIVPVYNVQDYLARCLDSILAQTYQNLEIILVNDGSKDNSGVICDEYAARDDRIQVIHKENGGLSTARNAGLDLATGEYLSFIDSDDWIASDAYEHLINLVERYQVQLVSGGNYDVYGDSGKMKLGICPEKEEVITAEEFVGRIFLWQGCDSSVCDKLFHRDLFAAFRFPVGKVSEDVALTYKIVLGAECVAMSERPFYYYYHRTGSISRTAEITEESFHFSQHTETIYAYIRQNHPAIEPQARYLRVRALAHILLSLEQSEESVRQKFWKEYRYARKELQKHTAFILTSTYFKKKEMATNILLNLGLYRMLRPIFHRG